MINTYSFRNRIRRAVFLLTCIAPLSIQAGPVAGEYVAARQVGRLLEDLADGHEIPQELALQCHLISLVSDVVTLRAAITTPSGSETAPAASVFEQFTVQFAATTISPASGGQLVRLFRVLSEARPQGP